MVESKLGTVERILALGQGFLVGAFALNLMAVPQRILFGIDLLSIKGMIVPTLFGGIAGLLISMQFLKRRKDEEELHQLNVELDRRVRDRTSELNRANENLKAEISERKRAEIAMRRTMICQKAILDNIPDMAWLKDKEGRFVEVNEPFAKACSIEAADLLGKTDFDFWPEELAQRYREDDEQVMRSGARKKIEETLVHHQGDMVWIETIKSPIYNDDGEVIGTTGIARDITARKQIQSDDT